MNLQLQPKHVRRLLRMLNKKIHSGEKYLVRPTPIREWARLAATQELGALRAIKRKLEKALAACPADDEVRANPFTGAAP